MPFLGIRRGDSPDPPPAQYATGPTMSGHTNVRALKTPAEVDAACQQWLGAPRWAPGLPYLECYVPALDAVFYQEGRKDQLEHGLGHARGWNHGPNGRGTSDTPLHNYYAQPPTLTQAQMDYLASLAVSPPASSLTVPAPVLQGPAK